MEDIISSIKELAAPILADNNIELVDIEYKVEMGRRVLRFFIDKEGGITLGDCERVSREVSAILDVKDIMPHSYSLEVSSPGIDRPLTKKDDFIRYKNKKARIKTKTPIQGRRNFSIVIEGVKDEDVVVRDSENRILEIPIENIEKARLEIV
ncbi:MAG: ribosome maturation factor RimP [Deltaproteobacteria bacterium]|nr:ribosome maturation factor RimP [Deltaproteobacteria bacterium]